MEKAVIIVERWIQDNNTGRMLELQDLDLEELPKIPPNVKLLNCSSNLLTKLPELPNCEVLSCFNNKLTELPELPKCEVLLCYGNKLRKLPNIPLCHSLNCSYNKLTSLPNLPKCRTLNASFNDIMTVGQLHNNVPMINFVLLHKNDRLYIKPSVLKKYNYVDKYILSINYPKFSTKIQHAYRKYKQRKTYNELQTLYNKNVSLVISQYI